MSGWFFLLGFTLQQRIDTTDQYNLSRQDLLGKQQAVCSPGVRENQNRSCPVPFWLPSFIFFVPSPEWSLGPMQIRHYSWDQSGKGMQIQCTLKTYQGKKHVGHVVPLGVFIQVSAFYFTFSFFLSFFFFFFTVHGVGDRLVVTSSTHHFIPVSPYSNCLTLAKKLFFENL